MKIYPYIKYQVIKVKKREELEKKVNTITGPYYKKLKTGIPGFDIGIGQAGVMLHGADEEKSSLVRLKMQAGYIDYQETLDKLTQKIKKKYNKQDFDIKSVDNITYLIKASNILPETSIELVANNIVKIMADIENINKSATTQDIEGKFFTPTLLQYYFTKIDFTIDLLKLDSHKYDNGTYVYFTNSRLKILEASKTLSKSTDISNYSKKEMFNDMRSVLPHSDFSGTVTQDIIEKLVPIHHKSGVIGINTIAYTIINGGLPIGIGTKASKVHEDFFARMLTYILDHDYQHVIDIIRKLYDRDGTLTQDTQKVFSGLKAIYSNIIKACNEVIIKNNVVDQTKLNEIKEDLLILFYLTHEDPLLSSGPRSLLGIQEFTPLPEKLRDLPFDQIKYAHKRALADSIFEQSAYIIPFSQMYPEFLEELQNTTNFEIKADQTGKLELSIAPHLINNDQVKALASMVLRYMAKTMENFYMRHKESLETEAPKFAQKFINDLSNLKEDPDLNYKITSSLSDYDEVIILNLNSSLGNTDLSNGANLLNNGGSINFGSANDTPIFSGQINSGINIGNSANFMVGNGGNTAFTLPEEIEPATVQLSGLTVNSSQT